MNLLTVQTLAEHYPHFTEEKIRWYLAKRKTNGLSKAVIRAGKRILIDQEAFETWLESQREG